jgi:hypothetical protein
MPHKTQRDIKKGSPDSSAFDFYGTCSDIFAATTPPCEQLFPGKGAQLAQT